MANYKKYAENLVGNWEKDIYEPQRDVTKAIYQTNWNKLTNDYNAVKDKLDRNFSLARNEYSNTLNDVQNTSFNRMNSANIDLANRGLSSSGMLDLVTQGDTQLKGESVDKALSDLLATNNASLSGLGEGVMGLGEGQTKLASDLAGDIGKLTEADAANNQQYAGLIAGIAEGAAQRAASRASGGGGSKKKSKKEQELDAMEKRLATFYVLNDDSLSDDEKRQQLVSIGIPVQDALNAISSVNYTKYENSVGNTRSDLEKRINNLQNSVNNMPTSVSVNGLNSSPTTSPLRVTNNNFNRITPITPSRTNTVAVSNRLQKELNDKIAELEKLNRGNVYTYKDLYDAIYGNIR